jgi:hypothetical protein
LLFDDYTNNWWQNPLTINDRLDNYELFNLLQQLEFYYARSQAHTFDELEAELVRFRTDFNIPAAELSIIQPASSRGVGWLNGCFETPPAG